MGSASLPGTRAALVVAHPGHELRLHGWLTRAHPVVHVLTDGSGATGAPRLDSTSRILEETGAPRGEVFGAFSDADLYAAILDGRVESLFEVVAVLARSFAIRSTDYVVLDAVEGYNPGHDLVSVLVAAAAALAERRGARRPSLFDYAVVGDPTSASEADVVHVPLGDDDLARKRQAGRAYRELRAEVDVALAEPEARQRREVLRPLDRKREPGRPPEDPPFYERHGERRVAEGRYDRVLRWRKHLRPVAKALLARADEHP